MLGIELKIAWWGHAHDDPMPDQLTYCLLISFTARRWESM